MRNLMERQLSWFALFMTALYSLLPSCWSADCGEERLVRCARPLERVSNNDLSFMMKKEELQQSCPELEAGMKCIQTYSVECLEDEEREHFSFHYMGTNKVMMQICQDGAYQDEFLKHAPCMQKVEPEYELCNKRYQRVLEEIVKGNRTARNNRSLKSVCCAFKEYLECLHHTVRRQCGDETAHFTKEMLGRMANSLLTMPCAPYTAQKCALGSSGGSSIFRIEALVPVVLVLLGRYFT